MGARDTQSAGRNGHARRALVFYPYLVEPGSGAQGVAAWIVHALQPDHEVTLLCQGANLEAANRRYGTSIDPRRVRIEILRSRLLERIPLRVLRVENLREWSLQRIARRKAPQFDLVICAGNEADLGGRGIQYVHAPEYPVFRRRGRMDWGWYHATSLLGIAYFEIGARLVGFSYARMRRNLTLVPSNWVGEWVHRIHGINPVTLYPPAAGAFPDVPWSERVNGFVWCGRLWPDRKVELAIDIVERVRQLGIPATLTLIGDWGGLGNPPFIRYGDRIRSLVREQASWATLYENVDRADLCRLMASHRYGVGTLDEGFGMAVAELVRAGNIVFVPRGGGQVEIVNHDERLLYLTAAEAAQKIARTMRDPELQESLRAALQPMRDRFSSDQFVREFRRLVGL